MRLVRLLSCPTKLVSMALVASGNSSHPHFFPQTLARVSRSKVANCSHGSLTRALPSVSPCGSRQVGISPARAHAPVVLPCSSIPCEAPFFRFLKLSEMRERRISLSALSKYSTLLISLEAFAGKGEPICLFSRRNKQMTLFLRVSSSFLVNRGTGQAGCPSE